MVEKTQKDAPKQKDESDQKIAYATYSFCCFYSHANMNRGLIESMGANDFAHVDFNILMEAFSSYYLKSLCFLLKKALLRIV